jgi:hypothetical protein
MLTGRGVWIIPTKKALDAQGKTAEFGDGPNLPVILLEEVKRASESDKIVQRFRFVVVHVRPLDVIAQVRQCNELPRR